MGGAVLAASPWLTGFYGMPLAFLLFMGAVNIAYGSYSASLLLRARRSRLQLTLLWGANGVWGGLCLLYIALLWDTLTVWGVLHLGLEALYVGGLGCVERRWMPALIRTDRPAN